MINELFERELRNTSINGVFLADYVKENYILKSVVEDIKAEIRTLYPQYGDGSGWCESRNITLNEVMGIIDKHISEKEKE